MRMSFLALRRPVARSRHRCVNSNSLNNRAIAVRPQAAP